MADNNNGNTCQLKPNSSSTEDLSEYTDADESISSAPTEFLAEFLSAVMMKDYNTALKYCKLILQYEPNNVTAKEFYPLIIEKLHQVTYMNENKISTSSSESDAEENEPVTRDDNDNEDESYNSHCGVDSDSEADSGESSEGGSHEDSNGKHSDGTTASYSSLEDDEPDINQLTALVTKYHIDNVDLENGNAKIATTVPVTIKKAWEIKNVNDVNTDYVTLNIQTSSDSESPTEPVSQQLIAQLRARVVPTTH